MLLGMKLSGSSIIPPPNCPPESMETPDVFMSTKLNAEQVNHFFPRFPTREYLLLVSDPRGMGKLRKAIFMKLSAFGHHSRYSDCRQLTG